jgi:hypothetical protein
MKMSIKYLLFYSQCRRYDKSEILPVRECSSHSAEAEYGYLSQSIFGTLGSAKSGAIYSMPSFFSFYHDKKWEGEGTIHSRESGIEGLYSTLWVERPVSTTAIDALRV